MLLFWVIIPFGTFLLFWDRWFSRLSFFERSKTILSVVETCKAKLVTKGNSQKPSFNYVKTFSLIAIKILLSITTHFNYEIWKMDVKITFLNVNIDENIYMMQQNGFILKD